MTTYQKTNANLPPTLSAKLIEARNDDLTQFQSWVIALRDKDWPLRAIAEPFGVTRVAAKAWHTRALQNQAAVEAAKTLVAPSLPLNARGKDARPKRLKPDVAPEDREKIATLAAKASEVRRYTPQDAPARAAARELEDLIYKYIRERSVSPSTIAQYANVSRRAIVQRYEKALSAREAVGK